MLFKNLSFLLFIFIFSCSNYRSNNQEQSPRIKSLTKLIIPKKNEKLNLNDSISIKINPKYDSIIINEISIIYNKDTIAKSNTNDITLKLNIFKSVGKHRITVVSFLDNDKKEVHYSSLMIYPTEVPQKLKYMIKNIYPHDPDAYTQGLTFDGKRFFESTGRRGFSTLREVEIKSGKIINQENLDKKYFGEGITVYKEKIYQLTWESNLCFIYDKNTMEKIDEFSYAHEGWGITTFNDELVISDGSENIYFINANNYKFSRQIQVYDNSGLIKNINELENVNGKIFANIYGKEEIIIFSPITGIVESTINLKGIFNKKNYNKKLDVLNGVAYNSVEKKLFVTGKWWPSLFEIEIIN